MKELKNTYLSPDKGSPYNTDKKEKERIDCGVVEDFFPCKEKCCNRANSDTDRGFAAICQYCSVWTSFPDSTSLEVVSVLECKKKGFARRIKL